MPVSILGLATAVPQHTMSQSEAAQMASDICCDSERQSRLLNVLYRRAGVENRHTVVPHRIALTWIDREPADSAVATVENLGPTTRERMELYEEHAIPLALHAAAQALARSASKPGQITHLVTVSCTGFVAPGVDYHLLTDLGLPATVARINVGFMGCHGAINGLRVAQALVEAQPRARVLLCAVELCSLHYRFRWDPERFIGNALFADGAASLVLGAERPDSTSHWQVAATGSAPLPDSQDDMTWRIGDHGYEMTLSPRVPDLIAAHLKPWLQTWLQQQGTELKDIKSWCVHPGGPRILSAVEQCLGLDADATAASRHVLAHWGNMSSPTVLFILDRLRQLSAETPCVALAFGPGLVAEAALFV